MSLGEPQHPVPGFVGPVLAKHVNDFGRYPIAKGIEPFRQVAAAWTTRRFGLSRAVDPETEVLVLNGSREGLFFAAIAAARYVAPREGAPVILMPNPFYPAYAAGARAAGCEVVFLPTTRDNGFLPNLDSLSAETLERTVAFISPARQSAGRCRLARLLRSRQTARRPLRLHRAQRRMLFEIYTQDAPGSMLASAGDDFANVVAFQPLSKRSNLPGMRVGLLPATPSFSRAFMNRNVAAPQVPVPLQHVAVAAYSDEAHVEENRRLYRIKFDLADQILGDRFGYKRPAGGFCIWLDVSAHGGDEAATVKLFKDGGVRVIPGTYLARPQSDNSNPGAGYIRVAMVQDSETTAEALHRMVEVLSEPQG